MKTNFSLFFYFKKPKNHQNGLVPIYLRITVNGKRAETSTGRECEPTLWNSTAGRFKGTKEEIKSFNAYLDNLQAQVYEAHGQLMLSKLISLPPALKYLAIILHQILSVVAFVNSLPSSSLRFRI